MLSIWSHLVPNCVLEEIQIKWSRKITKWLGERVAQRAIGTSFCNNYNSIARDVILVQNNTILFNAKNYKKYITQDGPLRNISNLEKKICALWSDIVSYRARSRKGWSVQLWVEGYLYVFNIHVCIHIWAIISKSGKWRKSIFCDNFFKIGQKLIS